VVLGASGLLLGAAERSPVSAACMEPALIVTPRQAAPGQTVTVSGRGWRQGCNDTVQCPTNGPCSTDPQAPARTGIEVAFSQGRQSDRLGMADAGNDSNFTVTAVVPRWSKAGAATVRADNVATGFRVVSGSGSAAELGAGAGAAALDVAAAPGEGEPLPRTGGGSHALVASLALVAGLVSRRLWRT
jgi:hypothetical protein